MYNMLIWGYFGPRKCC